jgi:hypothetical protein
MLLAMKEQEKTTSADTGQWVALHAIRQRHLNFEAIATVIEKVTASRFVSAQDSRRTNCTPAQAGVSPLP